jgi:hypothetical protein
MEEYFQPVTTCFGEPIPLESKWTSTNNHPKTTCKVIGFGIQRVHVLLLTKGSRQHGDGRTSIPIAQFCRHYDRAA